jgi:aspartate kinase
MVIKKYGGSALATPEMIGQVAEHIKFHLEQKPEPIIVVVSAMGDTTDRLLQMGRTLYEDASARELDMLISAGERISMAMMTIALQKLNVPAISFTGSQAGIMTSNKHGYASIKEIKPIRVDEELKKNKVVIIAGFQGVDPVTKEITTLGRGGTDTTAVALAAHYQARQCELYKDVDGILSAPPAKFKNAKLIRDMNYDTLLSLCYWGSKVVHHRAVELASKFNVPLAIGSWKTNQLGTLISNKNKMN